MALTDFKSEDLKSRVEELENGWSSLEVLHEETYGVLRGCVNTKLKIASILWTGNSNSAPKSTISINISDKYVPIVSTTTPMKCSAVGDYYMEVRSDKKVNLYLPNEAWCGCNITYHTI